MVSPSGHRHVLFGKRNVARHPRDGAFIQLQALIDVPDHFGVFHLFTVNIFLSVMFSRSGKVAEAKYAMSDKRNGF